MKQSSLTHTIIHVVLWISLAFLSSCSSDSSLPPDRNPTPGDGGFEELLEGVDAKDNLDATITISVIQSTQIEGLSTASAGVVQPVLLEVEAETQAGKAFKAVMVGSSSASLAPGSRAEMRLRAKRTTVNGQPLLAGLATLLTPEATDTTLFTGFSFLATKQAIQLDGPEVGSVYNFDGQADLRGFCTEQHVVGAALFSNRLETVRVVNASLALLNERLPCTDGSQVNASVQMNMEGTIVNTHLGKLLSNYGVMRVQRNGEAFTMPLFTIGAAEVLSDHVKQARFEAEIAPNVVVLEPFAISEIDDIQQGTLFFRNMPTSLAELSEGDIIVARPFPGLPEGAVRTVTDIIRQGQGVAITTDVADLSKVFMQGGFSFQRPLTAEDLTEDVVAAREGVDVSAFNDLDTLRAQAMQRQALSSQGLSTQALDFLPRVDLNVEIFPGIRLEGYFDVGAEPVIEFECRKAFCAELRVVGKFIVTEEAELALIGAYDLAYNETFELLTLPLGTYVIWAGVPITITPNIAFTVTLTASGALELNVVAFQSFELELGVEKPFGEGFKPVKEFSKDTSFSVDYNGSFEASARAAVRASITVLGTLSAYGDIGPYIDFEAQFPNDPLWELRGGINSYAGLEYDLLVVKDDVSFEIFDRNFVIGQGENTQPDIVDFSYQGAYFLEANQIKFPPDEPITFYANVLDPEEGSDCCDISWTLFKDNRLEIPQQATNAPNQSYSFTPTEVGNYSLQLRSEDTQGLSADLYSFDFTVEPDSIFELPPEIVTFDWTPNVSTIAAGTEINFTLRTDHPTMDDCCDVEWFINPELFGSEPVETTEGEAASVGRLHSFSRIPLNPGTYIIKAQVDFDFATGPGTPLPSRQVTFTVVDEGNQPPELDYIDIWDPAVGLPDVAEDIVFVAEFSDDSDIQGQGRSFDLEFSHAGQTFASVPANATVPFATTSFDSPGLKTITVVATDEDGASTTANFQFRIRDPNGSGGGYGF